MKKINSTGQLRMFLAGILEDVVSGDIDLDKARAATKVAGQINESLYAEIKVARVRAEAGEEMIKLGVMPLGEEENNGKS